MFVYRIEHKQNKIGPYYNVNRLPIDYYANDKHPDPRCSHEWRLLDERMHAYVFGFNSIQQLMNWFENELNILIEHDFICQVYEIPTNHICKVDDTQIAFDQDKAQKKETLKLDSLLTTA